MAGKRIQGITIEIDGNTTKLSKSLDGMDRKLQSTQSALKDVNRLLKLDPTNTELLSQKQKLLQSAVKDTEERLKELKEADVQAKAQLEAGDLGQDKYDALQREIIATEENLKSLKEQAKDSASVMGTKLQEAGEKIQEVGDKVTDVGKSLSKNVTAPITAIGAASIAAFNEVDDGLDIVVQKTGASGETLEEMESIVKKMAAEIPTSFEKAGEAVGEVNTRFGLTGDALETLSTKFVKFSDLNNTDVSASVDNVQKILTAFNLSADDAGAVLDTLNAVGQRTGISMDTLSSSMITNSASLQQMGFSASDAAEFLGNVEVSGADVSQVMSGLTKALANATEEGKPMNEALADIQNSMVNASSETEGLQAAYDLFGKKAGAAIYQACKTGSLSFSELGTSIDNNLGNVDETYENTIDGTDSLKTGMNSLKTAGAELGGALGDTLAPIIEQVSGKIQELTEWFSNLSPKTQETIVKVGLIAAAIGPILVIVGTVISAIGTVVSVIGTLMPIITMIVGIVSGVGAAISGILLPLAAIVAAIAVVISIGTLLYQNWDTIKQKASDLKDNISEKFEGIKTSISEKINGAKEAVTSAIDKIKNAFNFKWSLPELKLPHISVKGGEAPFGIGGKGSLPSFSIRWYKKAMDNAYLFDSAAIFGSMNGSFLGAGESGSEILMGKNYMIDMVQQASAQSNEGVIRAINAMSVNMLKMMSKYFPEFAKEKTVMPERELKRYMREMGVVFE